MPAYAYPAKINYEKEVVWQRGDTIYPDGQSVEELINDLSAVLKGMPESYIKSNMCVDDDVIYISYATTESDEQYNERISRLKKYNTEYSRRKID